MTLRLRLTLALLALTAVGLVAFGFVLTGFYSRSQYQRLDERLLNTAPFAVSQLAEQYGLRGSFGPGAGPGGRTPNIPLIGPGVDVYVELRDDDGGVWAGRLLDSDDVPVVDDDLTADVDERRFVTVGSTEGEQWRALIQRQTRGTATLSIVAVPTSEVTTSVNRLILIEVLAALGLLSVLGAGSWFVLRRGLRPLEAMATSATQISAGDLAQRVAPADDQTEVGQLGLALNTMLSRIEAAFAERDETENKLRRFLADASHELRTPLTSIQGFAELYRMGAAQDPEQLAIILRRIEQESARMKALVEELLLLARLDERRELDRAPVDLVVLCADACTDAQATDPGRRVTLDVKTTDVTVRGDAFQLRQALANLMTNAIVHTESGTGIDVIVAADANAATVTVRDHGAGLTPDALAHVFDRFWQADAARVGHGTGLGLSIVAAIVDGHGGEVSVSNHPDGGAAFTISLPINGDPDSHQVVGEP